MKRFHLLTAALFCSLLTFGQQPYSQRIVESLSLQNFNDGYKTNTLTTAGFSYVPGLVAKGVLVTYGLYPEKTEYAEYVKAYADRHLTGDSERPVRIGDNDIDAINAGKIFFDLYRYSMSVGDEVSAQQYEEAATYMRNKLKYNHTRIQAPLPGAGCFIHKARYPDQMWLDGLYMGAAFLAEWEDMFGEKDDMEAWSDIALQFKTIHRYTWDKKKKLNYHAWSANPTDANSFWARETKPHYGCSQEFWGRGEGWFFAALTDVLEVMPQNHPDYKKVLKIYRQVAKGLARWQSESGSWYQLLQYDETLCADPMGDFIDGNGKLAVGAEAIAAAAEASGRKTGYNAGTNANYLESSASSMFTYAYLKGLRLGLLSEKKFKPVALKAYQGLLDNFITENPDGSINILQVCASAGLGPARNQNRTGTINYYLCGGDTGMTYNEGKALGSFTLASCEYERLMMEK